MKRKTLAFFLFLAFAGSQTQAQTSENTVITATANVISALSITHNSDVDFGNLSATTSGIVFLDPKGSNSNYVGATAQAGKLTIAGASEQSILLSWPESVTLTGNANDELVWNLQVNGSDADNVNTSIELTSSGQTVTTSADGGYFLYVGGELGGTAGSPAALSTQPAGEYTGTATFSVDYN